MAVSTLTGSECSIRDCVQVIEEENGREKLRPQCKLLMASLESGDGVCHVAQGFTPHHPSETEYQPADQREKYQEGRTRKDHRGYAQ